MCEKIGHKRIAKICKMMSAKGELETKEKSFVDKHEKDEANCEHMHNKCK